MIAAGGPMPVSRYMSLCLAHPQYGYYTTRDPFGAGGDFTTAPEVSQIFGELLGLWSLSVWRMLGEPEALNLVELGPGRGTMMRDALRAARSCRNSARRSRSIWSRSVRRWSNCSAPIWARWMCRCHGTATCWTTRRSLHHSGE